MLLCGPASLCPTSSPCLSAARMASSPHSTTRTVENIIEDILAYYDANFQKHVVTDDTSLKDLLREIGDAAKDHQGQRPEDVTTWLRAALTGLTPLCKSGAPFHVAASIMWLQYLYDSRALVYHKDPDRERRWPGGVHQEVACAVHETLVSLPQQQVYSL